MIVPMKAKDLFIILISILLAFIFLHLGLNIVLGIRGDLNSLDSTLMLASRTISGVVYKDLREIDRIIALRDSLDQVEEFLPEGTIIINDYLELTNASDPLPEYGDWRIMNIDPPRNGLLFVRELSGSRGDAFLGYSPDLSWANYLFSGVKWVGLRMIAANGNVLWEMDQPVSGGDRSSGWRSSGVSDLPMWSRTAAVDLGAISLVAVFPALPFLFSALSKLPWTLGVEIILIVGVLVIWLTFSRYLITPLERVTRLALQMQDRIFRSVSSSDLAESVVNLAAGIRDITSNSKLSEARVFCQTLSSALHGYVFQQEKIAHSDKELEDVNRSLSEANRQLLRRDSIWRNILEVSRNLSIESGFQEGLEKVSGILAEATGAFGVVIGKIDNDRIEALAWSGFEGVLEIRDAPLEGSFIGRSIISGSPVWVENVRSDPAYCQFNHKVKSQLNIPMFHIGKAVGGLLIAWDRTRAEEPAMIELVMPVAMHVAGLLNTQVSMMDLKNSYKYIASRLQNLTAIYHDETSTHLERMEHYCRFLAAGMSRSYTEIEDIALFARLHDIGKLRVPRETLAKPGGLDGAEFEIVKNHAAWGAEILGDASWLEMGRKICLYHHEKWDGTGYPEGLSGEDIPWEARIVALADAYDALRSSRSYKPALTHLDTVRVIINGDGRLSPKHFEPELLEFFKKFHHKMAEIFESFRDHG